MTRQRRQLWLCIALLGGGCAPAQAPGETATGSAPSAQDLTDAMGDSMPPLPAEEGGYFCAIPTDLKCVRTNRLGRYQCSYRAQGDTHRTVLERTGRTEREPLGHWRWVSGWKSCGILY